MSTSQIQADPEVQAAIFRVALSLDSFLLNGIQYGVVQRVTANGFLQKTAGSLLSDLASLEEQAAHAPATEQPRVTEILAALRARCQRVIDLVRGLTSFRTLSLQQLHATVSQIPLLRGECVQLIQELEACFRTTKLFYQSRPSHSTAAINDFLANLQRFFADERAAAVEPELDKGTSRAGKGDSAGKGDMPELAQTRGRGEMRHLDCNQSLHLMGEVFQKTFMAEQCELLIQGLDCAIEATRRAVPIRQQPYVLDRKKRSGLAGPESKLEEAMWRRWSGRDSCDAVPGAWYRIIGYQLMLRDENENSPGWGEVDLVGVSYQGLPTVIEIKRHNADDSPLRFIVQAAAYAIAIQKAWDVLGKQWAERVKAAYGFELCPSKTLHSVPLVCGAHQQYWDAWIGKTPRARRVRSQTWVSITKLVAGLAERGFPATFLKLDYHPDQLDADGLPEILGVQVLDPFVSVG